MRRVGWRLLPFLTLCYLFAQIDRGNIGMAALQMNHDLGLTPKVFGFASSLFFISYCVVEVPSNLMLQRVGARIWIARIMITWGLVSAGHAFVRDTGSLYAMRFLLGAAEAGFFPGVLLYLTYWLPSAFRGRMVALFMVAIPLANFVGSPISGWLLSWEGMLGLRGWQWVFIVEGIPSSLLGLACLFLLTDGPAEAKWLSAEQRAWLSARLQAERVQRRPVENLSTWRLLINRDILLLTLVYAGASATGSTMSVWQPQLLKSFGLSDLQTGLVNAVPYGLASIMMILWGRHSDRTGERTWHTAATLLLIFAGLVLSFAATSLGFTVLLLSMVLVGAYALKGPFWALASGWLSSGTAAAGLAAITAFGNLIGGGLMVNVYGMVREESGSYSAALMPLAALCLLGAVAVVAMSRSQQRKAGLEAAPAA